MKPFLLILLTTVSLFSYEFNSLPNNKALMSNYQRSIVSVNGQVSMDSTSLQLLVASFSVPITLYKTVGIEVNHLTDTYGQSGTSVKTAFAIKPWKQLSIGGVIGYRYYKDSEVHHDLPFDLGVNYAFFTSPVIEDMVVGVSAQNITGITPDSLKLLTTPRSVKIDWSTSFLSRRIALRSELGVDIDERIALYGVDFLLRPAILDVGYTITNSDWFLYGGFRPAEHWGVYLRGGWGQDREKRSFARFTLSKEFGQSREMVMGKKHAKYTTPGPGKLYTQMRQNFAENNFLEALILCKLIFIDRPDFFKKDWVQYYMAASFEQLGLTEVTYATVDSTLIYTKSPALFSAKLLLSKLYLEDNDPQIEDNYQELKSSSAYDSLKYANDIVMGLYYLRNGRTTRANSFFNNVPKSFVLFGEAQRGLRISAKIKSEGEFYSIKDTLLLEKYSKGIEAYQKLGIELKELLYSPQSSFIMERIEELEVEIKAFYPVIQEYKKAWEKESERLGGSKTAE